MAAESAAQCHEHTEPCIIRLFPATDGSGETLLAAYDRLCRPKDQQQHAAASIQSVLSGLTAFSDWYAAERGCQPVVQAVLEDASLLWGFAGSQIAARLSPATVLRKLLAVRKVLSAWSRQHGGGPLPEIPGAKALERMQAPLTAASPFDLVQIPETVTLQEFQQLRAHCGVATWPRLPGGITPEQFWQTVLDCHWTYGFRSQDWFGVHTSRERGLLWTQLSLTAECPLRPLKSIMWPHGWVCFWMRKTKRHVAMPLSSRVRSHIELFRGLHPERVFPIPWCKQQYYRAFHQIRAAAGVDQRITLSGRSSPSLRKGCTVFWDNVAGGHLTSAVLGHAVRSTASRSHITDRYYAQLLRQVCQHIEDVPF